MATQSQFRREDIAAVPRGYKVRTVTHSSGHRVRLAFPPGRRHKGAGRLISILHPSAGVSNPCATACPLSSSLRALGNPKNPWDAAAVKRILDAAKRRGVALAESAKTAVAGNPSASVESGPEIEAAAELYRTFHGKEPKEIIELQETEAERGTYAAIGPLEELVLRTPGGPKARLDFSRDGVKLASNPAGTQLYLIGGNQDLSDSLAEFGSDSAKDFIDLGEAFSVTYQARKAHNNFNLASWRHKFGEEGGDRPLAFYDKLRKRIFLVGGSYKVEQPGIIN